MNQSLANLSEITESVKAQKSRVTERVASPPSTSAPQNFSIKQDKAPPPIKSPGPVAPPTSLSDSAVKKAGDAYQKKVYDTLKTAAKENPKSKLGQYYQLTKILNEYGHYKKTGTGPLAGDEDALRLVRNNEGTMRAKLKKLANDPEVQKTFETIRKDTLKAHIKDPQKSAEQLSAYLTGDTFASKLNGKDVTPKQRKAMLSKEILKLSMIDPKLAQKTVNTLIQRQMEVQYEKNLNTPGPEQIKAKRALKKSLMGTVAAVASDHYGNASKVNKSVEVLQDILADKAHKNPRLLMTKEGWKQTLADLPNSAKFKALPAELQKEALVMADKMNNVQVRQAVFSKAALIGGIYGLSQAKNKEQVASSLSMTVDGVANLSKVALLAKMPVNSKLVTGLTKAGMLGPVGDALGVAADIAGAFRESDNEDSLGLKLKVASAVAGTAGMIGGVALMAGASGPAAPLVVGGAAVIGLGIAGAEYLFAESDKAGDVRKALRSTGISDTSDKDVEVIKKSEHFYGDDYEEMTKNFNKMSPKAQANAIHYLLDDKEVTTSKKRVRAVVDMIKQAKDKKALFKHLNQQTMGFMTSSHPEIARDYAGVLVDTWPQNVSPEKAKSNPEQSKAIRGFLEGFNESGNTEELKKTFKGNAGEIVMSRLNYNDFKAVVSHKSTPAKNVYTLLNNSTWRQFNALTKKEGLPFFKQLLPRFKGEDHKLVGRMGAWGFYEGASKDSAKVMTRLLESHIDNDRVTTKDSYGRAAEGFVDEMKNVVKDNEEDPRDVFARIPDDLAKHVHASFKVDDGVYTSDNNYKLLKKYRPRSEIK